MWNYGKKLEAKYEFGGGQLLSLCARDRDICPIWALAQTLFF